MLQFPEKLSRTIRRVGLKYKVFIKAKVIQAEEILEYNWCLKEVHHWINHHQEDVFHKLEFIAGLDVKVACILSAQIGHELELLSDTKDTSE